MHNGDVSEQVFPFMLVQNASDSDEKKYNSFLSQHWEALSYLAVPKNKGLLGSYFDSAFCVAYVYGY